MAENLSMGTANVTPPGASAPQWMRHRVTIRDGELVVKDRRSNVVLTASVISWSRDRRQNATIVTDTGTVIAARAGCNCGGR